MSKPDDEIIPSRGSVLYIDVGNSTIKAAFTEGINWKQPEQSGLRKASDLLEWINQYSDRFQLITITSVVDKITEALTEGINADNYRILTKDDIPPDLLDYETPKTLGLDRFFGCYGAVAHTREPAVVVDAGTACTIDYMTGDHIFRGGVIMPGVSIIENSFRDYVSGLPRVGRSIPGEWPGKSTETAMQWGITGTFRDGLLQILDRYEQKFDSFELVITGGDAEMISGLLERKNKVRPLVVFEGMKKFLDDYI